MKLRVLRNSLHGRQVVGLVLGGLLGLAFAATNLLTAAIPFENPRITVDLLATLYGVWLLGWVIAPIATGGGDETLRPQHFALLPIGRRKLALGLLAASFVGVPALVSLIAFAGLVVYGARLGTAPALVGLVFTVLQLVFVVVLYRVATAALGSLLTSRKGKELGILLVALTGLSGVAVNYAVNSVGPALVAGRASGLAAVARALPSGWGADAVRMAADGRWGIVALLLASIVALIAFLVACWGALMASTVTRGQFRGGASRRAADTAGTRRRALLPRGPVSAVARKELRTWGRDARRRIAIFSGIVLAVVIAIVPFVSAHSKAFTAPYLALYVVFAGAMQTGNLYGFDGSALWHTLVVPGAIRADVRGRQLAWALIVGPVALLFAAVLPAATGKPGAYPWVLSLVPALVGAGAGIVLLQSVFVAYPLPDPRKNSSPFAQGGRPGCARGLLALALLGLLALGAAPVVAIEVLAAATDFPALAWAGIPAGLVLGPVLAWWWGGIAERRLAARGPETLALVSKER
ncbi:hypothetical protein [Amycolatopsis sp. CA-230715]|uniref:hypothetical protein n=1 Tax=Amycolatopsis sp. CA-230715 TaxID=2745196 RepID=UPI001C33C770|nr:hypothetical protein [Amycolatopsis sp. CA-230715]QWF78304.1 hypothetical protein HUW46_01699 [Amycolatopsis sp. CA-230715]